MLMFILQIGIEVFVLVHIIITITGVVWFRLSSIVLYVYPVIRNKLIRYNRQFQEVYSQSMYVVC